MPEDTKEALATQLRTVAKSAAVNGTVSVLLMDAATQLDALDRVRALLQTWNKTRYEGALADPDVFAELIRCVTDLTKALDGA